jgi:hypothetical protein
VEKIIIQNLENNLQNFEDDLLAAIGKKYPFKPFPIFFSQERFQKLIDKTHAIIRFLETEKYYQEQSLESWFLPIQKLKKNDFIGCVDFFVTETSEKLIEVNFMTPGYSGLIGLFDEVFSQNYPEYAPNLINKNTEKKIVNAVTEQGKYQKIAITVSHLPSSDFYRQHYAYIEKVFARFGFEAKVCFARDIQSNDLGEIIFDGIKYDKIFNLLIVLTWEQNQSEFSKFTEFYKKSPHAIFPNPLGMKLAYKPLLSHLYQADLLTYGLSEKDATLIKDSLLKAAPLAAFHSIDEVKQYFEGQNVILKPNLGYHTKGVIAKPTEKQFAEAFENKENYVVQEFFEKEIVSKFNSQTQKAEFFEMEIRMAFINGQFEWTMAFVEPPNQSLAKENYSLNPIIVK